jgi:hypothetical protein
MTKNRSQLLVEFADNNTGNISAGDMRDFVNSAVLPQDLFDTNGSLILGYGIRDTSHDSLSVDTNNRLLIDSSGNLPLIDWTNTPNTIASISFYEQSPIFNEQILDNSNNNWVSIDTNARQLIDSSGNLPLIDWTNTPNTSASISFYEQSPIFNEQILDNSNNNWVSIDTNARLLHAYSGEPEETQPLGWSGTIGYGQPALAWNESTHTWNVAAMPHGTTGSPPSGLTTGDLWVSTDTGILMVST